MIYKNKDRILETMKEHEKIRSELIEHLKELMKNRNIVQTKHIKRAVYKFIFKRVFKDIKKEDRKKIDKFSWKLYKRVVDWILTYGYIITETLLTAREYEDQKIRMHKIDDDIIDA